MTTEHQQLAERYLAMLNQHDPAMAVWLLIYRSVSAPVNRQLSAAAHDGRIPGDARALQRQWDHVINARAALQTVAVAALCAALILS